MASRESEKATLLPAPVVASADDDHAVAYRAHRAAVRTRCVLAGVAIYLFLVLLDPFDLIWPEDDGARIWSSREVEHAFLGVPTNASIRETSFELTRSPHVAGSKRDLETAQIMLRQWSHYLGVSKALANAEPVEAGSYESLDALRGRQSTPRVWIDTCASASLRRSG